MQHLWTAASEFTENVCSFYPALLVLLVCGDKERREERWSVQNYMLETLVAISALKNTLAQSSMILRDV